MVPLRCSSSRAADTRMQNRAAATARFFEAFGALGSIFFPEEISR
jgi:hypothetical protein